jgi:hypothetical protein
MRKVSTTPWLSNCGFGWFQNNSLAPTINLAPEWPPFNPKISFGMVDERILLCISPYELTTTERKVMDNFFPMELTICWVSELIDNYLEPIINLARMDPIQSKITFGVADKRFLHCIIPAELTAAETKRLDDSVAI